MADATLRGSFDLSGESALRTLRDIRDAGLEADAALASVGDRLDSLDRQRSSPSLSLSGFDKVNAQLSELEMRLDRLDRRRVSSHVSVGGGFSNIAGGGGLVAGDGRSPLFSSLGGLGGRLPWWAAALPAVPQLLGGAGALVGSGSAAALGAGVVGLGGAGAFGFGGLVGGGMAKNAASELTAVVKAQTAYNHALQEFGPHSARAASAQKALNLQLALAPAGAAGAARQVSRLGSEYQSATAPGYQAFYGSVAQGAYNFRRALPQVAPFGNTALSTIGRSGVDLTGFLTDPRSIMAYGQLTSAFAQELPIAERSLQNILRLFENLSVAALPFFHQANVWVQSWTAGMAASSGNTSKVQQNMAGMVTAGKDWLGLAGALGRTLKDVFAPSVQPGNSMVVDLTHTLDRWDSWLRDNPDKVRQFFRDGEQGVSRIAAVIANLTRDVFQLFQALSPILTRAEQFIKFASGLGGGNLALGGALLYGGYTGLRGGLGGRGPSAASALSTFVMGPSAFRGARGSTATAAATADAMSLAGVSRASNAAVARGVTSSGAFLMGPATVGTAAVLERRATAAEANIAAAERGALASRMVAAQDALSTTRLGQSVARVAESVPGAMIKDAAATGMAVGRSVLGGIAKVALPILGINAVLQGLQPTAGGAAGHFQNAVSGLTGGLVPRYQSLGQANAQLGQQVLAQMPPGLGPNQQLSLLSRLISGSQHGPSDLPGRGTASTFAKAQMSILAGMANRTTTPAGAAQLQALTARVRLELDPQDQQRFSVYLQQIADTAAKNAGLAASNQWQQSFATALDHGMKPEKAVATMLSGMNAQLGELKPAGQKALASSTAAWVQQLEIANPKLRRPLEHLMNGIIEDMNRLDKHTGTTMQDLQNKVFYFNGQIYTGMSSTWSNIWTDLTNGAQVGQEKLSHTFQLIQQEAVNALTGMGFSRQNAQRVVTQAMQGGGAAANAAAAGTAQGAKPVAGGFSPLSPTAPAGLGRARGGQLAGGGMLDTLPLPDGSLAAPGEAWIANRHTMSALSSATLPMFGKTAWEMIRDEPRMHSAPMRRFTTGGAFGPVAGALGTSYAGGGGGYIYPFPGSATLGRTDQGVDVNMPPGSAIGPMGAAVVKGIVPNWYHNQPLIYWQLQNGPRAGQYGYAAEQITSLAPVGARLGANQAVARYAASGTGLEYGWATAGGQTLARATTGYREGQVTPAGSDMRAFLAGLAHGKITGGFGAAGAFGAPVPQISLHSPRSGLGGYLGPMVDQGGRMFAGGLEMKVNSMIGAGGGFAGNLTGSVENQVAQFMRGSGFNRIAIAGMLGNAYQESAMNPNTPGGGLWQQISNFGSGTGGSLLHQMQTMLPQIAGLRGALNAAGSPGAAATIFEQGFERAGIPAMANRISAANAAYAAGYGRGGALRWGGWHRKGVDMTVDRPTLFGAGEGGRRERVRVGPAASPTGPAGHRISVTVNVERLSAHPEELDAIGEHIGVKLLEALDRVGQGESDAALMGAGPGVA